MSEVKQELLDADVDYVREFADIRELIEARLETLFPRRPIGAQRLKAIPWARYCVDCQEKEERGSLE